ncbi:MAG: class I SAM-dependent methyltransferase [Desertimonas sp.]
MSTPDPIYADPRLAAVYDALDPDRGDLDHYVAIIEELGARRVLDVGCGTGSLASLLSARGLDVTGVDPAAASLAIARTKPGADAVRWVDGDAPALARTRPGLGADLAVMTGNVAQVFVDDETWDETLRAVHVLVRPRGHLVFETRIPQRRAWLAWNGPGADAVVEGVGWVSDRYEVETVEELAGGGVLVTFNSPTTFHDLGVVIDSRSTLRFRTHDELLDGLAEAGFDHVDTRDAPDRPGCEWVVIARRRPTADQPTTSASFGST